MDTARLAEALSYLEKDEREYQIQAKLIAVRDNLNNLSANPSDASSQTNFSNALNELSKALADLSVTYSPTQRDRIYALGAKPYFSSLMVTQIRQSVTQNPISPSVTLGLINKLIEKRGAYLDQVKRTLLGLEDFELDVSELNEGEADVGFELPRDLFGNKLHGLINELRSVQRIIRVISEVETGSVCDPDLHDISASDPIFFLGADPVTIASIAGAVAWALNQWKKIEEIRKLRTETKKVESFTEKEVADFFDSKIKRQIDQAVEERTSEMLERSRLSQARKNELTSETEWALRAVLARVERGVKIEVRFLEATDEEASTDEAQRAAAGTLSELAAELVFPKSEGKPVLALPAVKDADPVKVRKTRKKPKPPTESAAEASDA
jgi:hypothetical protein